MGGHKRGQGNLCKLMQMHFLHLFLPNKKNNKKEKNNDVKKDGKGTFPHPSF